MADEILTLGRGDLYFGKFDNSTAQVPEGELMFGNTPSLTLTMTVETLSHYSMSGPTKVEDRNTTIQTGGSGTFSTDNISKENLASLFLGTSSILTTSALADQTETFPSIIQGRTYQLGTSNARPSGVRKVADVVVKVASDTKVLNTDYTVDLELGRVTVIEGGTIAAGASMTVEYDISASTRQRIISGSAIVEGSMRFISHNQEGHDRDYFLPWVKLTPSGDFSLKGDDWMTITYTIGIQKKGSLERVYVDGRPLTV